MVLLALVVACFLYPVVCGFTLRLPFLTPRVEPVSREPEIPFITPKHQNLIPFEFVDCRQEISCCLATDAPLDLQGTYFRNGPGIFSVGGSKIQHPFDGDGMLLSVSISAGRVFFRNKIIHTKGYLKEQQQQQICYRGVFGTKPCLDRGGVWSFLNLIPKNTANTHVLYWNQRLFALWDCGRPYEIDPQTLNTLTESNHFPSLDTVGSHYKVDPRTGHLILFAATPTPWWTRLQLSEYDLKLQVVRRHTVVLPGFAFLHDFAITENYYLFLQSPLNFQPLPFLFGSQSIMECISFDKDRSAMLYLVNRRDGTVDKVAVPACFSLHTVNAYEEEGGSQIIFDLILAESLHSLSNPSTPLQESVGRSQMHRLEISRNSLSDQWTVSKIQRLTGFSEFPTIHPHYVGKKHRFVYSLCGSNPEALLDFRGITRFDCQLHREEKWIAPTNSYLSEPIFATKTPSSRSQREKEEEGEGYILTILSNGEIKMSQLLIFDANQIAKGPIHQFAIPLYLPPGLHGSFVSDVC